MHDKNSRLPGEVVFTILLLALSVFLLVKAIGISGFEALSSPGAFPMALAAVMVLSMAVITLRTVKLPRSTRVLRFQGIAPWRILFMIVMVVLYAVALQPVGFLVTSFLFLLVSMQVLGSGGFRRNLAITVISLILVYAIFRLIFSVLMPEGIVPEREIIRWARDSLAGGA